LARNTAEGIGFFAAVASDRASTEDCEIKRKGDSLESHISRFVAQASTIEVFVPERWGLKNRMVSDISGWYIAREHSTPRIAEKKSCIRREVNTRLRILSAHRRAFSRTMMDPLDRKVEMSMSKGISRRAGEEGEETDMVRVERLMEGLIRAIRGYCF
jgi:hypothetical protein